METIQQILKLPAGWTPPKLDPNDPKVVEYIRDTKQAQEYVLSLKEVDVTRLRETIINI